MARALRGGSFGREDPSTPHVSHWEWKGIICITVMPMADSQICGTRVKIQVQRLPSNGNGAEVLGIILLGRSSHTAISSSGQNIRRGSGSELLVRLQQLEWT